MARPMPVVPGVTHQDIQAGDVTLHVATAGDPSSPPMLLLHGWPQHWYLWRDVMPAIADRYYVIAPDLRGFGWSDAPPSGYAKEQLASDILTLLDAMGIERIKMVGHDWGGWVGYLIALRAPERIERYLALNILPPFMPGDARKEAPLSVFRFWYQLLIGGPLGAPFLRRGGTNLMWKFAMQDDAALDAGERAAFTDALREPARARASQLLYREFLMREIREMMGGRYHRMDYTVPTLLLFGDQDAAQDARLLRNLSDWGKGIELQLAPGVGHFIVDERPDLVIETIGSFFTPSA